jgi:hypothetical protein
LDLDGLEDGQDTLEYATAPTPELEVFSMPGSARQPAPNRALFPRRSPLGPLPRVWRPSQSCRCRGRLRFSLRGGGGARQAGSRRARRCALLLLPLLLLLLLLLQEAEHNDGERHQKKRGRRSELCCQRRRGRRGRGRRGEPAHVCDCLKKKTEKSTMVANYAHRKTFVPLFFGFRSAVHGGLARVGGA